MNDNYLHKCVDNLIEQNSTGVKQQTHILANDPIYTIIPKLQITADIKKIHTNMYQKKKRREIFIQD